MKTFVILAIVAINFILAGFKFIKGIYEELNDLMSMPSSEKRKPSLTEILFCVGGAVFGIIGAVLFYQICAAAMDKIIVPRHPVEEPVPYGIGMIIISLFFAGGLLGSFLTLENIEKDEYSRMKSLFSKGSIIASAVLFVTYLILKGMMILP